MSAVHQFDGPSLKESACLQEAHALVLSTADWDAPLWTNKQYVASELARIFRVTFVESLGLRRPTASTADLHRARKRLRSGFSSSHARGVARGRPSSLEVVSPLVLPYHELAGVGRFNARALHRSIRGWLESPSRLLWTFSPITYGLEDAASATVYHAVDLLHTFPRVNGRTILSGERSLARAGLPGIASSTGVRDHLLSVGFHQVSLWENVADVPTFVRSARERREPGHVLFAGNLSPHKVDFHLLERVARHRAITLHIAGPVGIDGSSGAATDRLSRAGALLHGALDPYELASLAGKCSVGLIPYLVNDYTAGVFPMKLYEYLAAGLQVVSTELPTLSGHAGRDLIIADSAEAFVGAATARPPTPTLLRRRQALALRHSWERRGQEARNYACALLYGAPIDVVA